MYRATPPPFALSYLAVNVLQWCIRASLSPDSKYFTLATVTGEVVVSYNLFNDIFCIRCRDTYPYPNLSPPLATLTNERVMHWGSADQQYHFLVKQIWEVCFTKKGENWEFEKTKKVSALPNGHRVTICINPDPPNPHTHTVSSSYISDIKFLM